ncbi:glycosyltransferase family 25 protein [Carboxylicivirga taeanensis]|uniref:glycosyltransferase family 25 protein n=1 Tax=Carboxylicivirga taeanensis TaxID=1416875 RepID=UPI003F6DF5B6
MNTNALIDDCKIYVIHAPNGYEHHGNRVKSLFAKHNLEFEFVHEESTEHLNELIATYCNPQIVEKFRKGGVACTVSHLLALEKFLTTNKKYALIFEDDPFFLGNFTKKLNKHTKEFDKLEPGFIVSLENTRMKFPSFFQMKKGKHLYRANMGRMACAYIIDVKGARNALNDLKRNKCNEMIDWWHNRLINNNVLKLYWLHPPIVEQGSHNGRQTGTISSRQNCYTRILSWQMQKFYKYYINRLFKQKSLIQD